MTSGTADSAPAAGVERTDGDEKGDAGEAYGKWKATLKAEVCALPIAVVNAWG